MKVNLVIDGQAVAVGGGYVCFECGFVGGD